MNSMHGTVHCCSCRHHIWPLARVMTGHNRSDRHLDYDHRFTTRTFRETSLNSTLQEHLGKPKRALQMTESHEAPRTNRRLARAHEFEALRTPQHVETFTCWCNSLQSLQQINRLCSLLYCLYSSLCAMFSTSGFKLNFPASCMRMASGNTKFRHSNVHREQWGCNCRATTVALLSIVPLGAIIRGGNSRDRSAVSRYFSHEILTQVVQYLASLRIR
jgi:hypothetical protein